MGKTPEADAVMDKAFQLDGADMVAIHIYASGLLAGGRNEKALEAFKINQQKHPEEKFFTYFGLAGPIPPRVTKQTLLRTGKRPSKTSLPAVGTRFLSMKTL
jgi:hypothetical protein